MQMFPLDKVMQAQAALRATAGLPAEEFPVESFVGMISDEIEGARKAGKTDEEIVGIIRASSGINLDAATLAEHYATPAQRQRHD